MCVSLSVWVYRCTKSARCRCVTVCGVVIVIATQSTFPSSSSPPHPLLPLPPPSHRSFMQVCQEALDLNGHLISTDQLMYQDELRNKFQQMQATLTPLLQAEEKVCGVCLFVHATCAVHLCMRSVCYAVMVAYLVWYILLYINDPHQDSIDLEWSPPPPHTHTPTPTPTFTHSSPSCLPHRATHSPATKGLPWKQTLIGCPPFYSTPSVEANNCISLY